MRITVLAERFEDSELMDWEHLCDDDEIEAVADSAKAMAFGRGHFGPPNYVDFLKGTQYIFNTAFGPAENPRNGDLRVYAAIIDGMLIGDVERIERHFVEKHKAA